MRYQILLLAALFASPGIAGQHQAELFSQLHQAPAMRTIVLVRGNPRDLAVAGFDLARHGTESPGEPIHVVVDAHALERLRSLGYLIVGELPTSKGDHKLADGWLDYAQAMAQVSQIVADNANIMSVLQIGKSVEGRPLIAVRISSSPRTADPTKPRVSFNAAHHSREVMTVEVALDILTQIAGKFREGDARAKRWIQGLEVYVTPMVNPDGYNYVHTADTWWRKNRRDLGEGQFGVDLNRNYPYSWGANNEGSSGDKSDETYRGSGPASEPEVQAMVNFARQIYPLFNMSFHSYGETLLYPYGYENAQNPQGDVMEDLSREVTKRLIKDTGSGTFERKSRLYPVNGLDRDWYYFELGSYCFVPEISASARGFHPDHSYAQKTVEGLRGGWQYLLDRALGSGIRGRVVDAAGAPLVAKVTVEGVVWRNGEPELSSADGYFHRLLRPGTYTLHIQAPKHAPATQQVTIPADTFSQIQVQLAPVLP